MSKITWAVVALCLPLCAQSHELNQYTSYGKIRSELRKVADKRAKQAMTQLDQKIKEKCHKAKKKAYGKPIDFKKHLNCSFNVKDFLQGRAQSLIKGKITRGEVGTLNYKGVKVQLSHDVNYVVNAKPIHKNYRLGLLDRKKSEYIRESRYVHKNIALQHRPATDRLYTKMCMNFPGVDINAQISSITAKAEKKLFWFVKAKANAHIQIDLGRHIAQTASICGLNTIKVKDIGLKSNKPKLQVKNYVEPLKFHGLKTSGIRVLKVKVSGGNFLTKVVFWVAKSLRVKAESMVLEALQKQLVSKINGELGNVKAGLSNGSIWKRVFENSVKSPNVLLATDLQRTIANDLRDDKAKAFRFTTKRFKQHCRQYKSKYGQIVSDNFNKVCDDLALKVKIIPFRWEKGIAKKKCYSKYYTVHMLTLKTSSSENSANKPRNLWWTKQCRIRSTVRFTGPDKYNAGFQCLRNGIRDRHSYSKIEKTCGPKLMAAYLGIPERKVTTALKQRSPARMKGYIKSRAQLKSMQSKLKPSMRQRSL